MNFQRTVLQVERTIYAKALQQGKAFRVLRQAKAPRVEGVGKRVGRWGIGQIGLGLAGHEDELGLILNATGDCCNVLSTMM